MHHVRPFTHSDLSSHSLIRVLKEKGILYCIRRSAQIFLWRPISWIFPSLRFLFPKQRNAEKRVLAIWDFQSVPYSIGELLYLQEVVLMLRWLHRVNKIDIAFVCDPLNPARGDQGLTSYNFHYHLGSLVPMAQVNPHLGNFFLFDSYKQLEKYVRDNMESYHIWPSGIKYFSKARAYAQNFDFIEKFYYEQGFIPHLSCRAVMLDWAHAFFGKHVLPDIGVVVQLRNNHRMLQALDRNSRMKEWLLFFQSCKGYFPVKFVVVCASDEIDSRLRSCSNVLIAKDYHTTIEQDLALIQCSAMFMGGPSGPATMAIMSDVPYVLFNFRPANEKIAWGTQLPFANEMQRVIWEPETAEDLRSEFKEIFDRISTEIWVKEQETGVDDLESLFCLR